MAQFKRVKMIFLSAALALVAGGSMAETLGDAMAGAYKSSGLLEQNRAVLRAADEDVAIAQSALRPVVQWTIDVQRRIGSQVSASTRGQQVEFQSSTAEASISAQLTIYDFGASTFALDAAKEQVLATREQLVGIEQQVLLQAVSAFMSVREASELVELRRSNYRVITRELGAARDRFDVGEVTRTDVALAEARLAGSRAQLAAAEGQLAQAIAEYKAAVGRKPGRLSAPKGLPKLPSALSKAQEIAVRRHPEVRAAQHGVSAADLNILRAEAVMKPTISLNAGVSASGTFDSPFRSDGASIGLRAQQTIYAGGRLSALLRQAMAQRDARRGALHATVAGVQKNVAGAWANLRVQQASRKSSAQQIRASRVAFEGVREEAKLGARTTLDVLNAEQDLRDAQSAAISAAVNEQIAAYQLLSSMGLLTVDNLNLDVPRYDPASYYNLVKNAPPLSAQGEKLNRVLEALGKK